MAKFTQEQLDTLIQAIAEGALIVWYGDKRVEYRTLTEMLQIKKMMEDDLTPPTQKRPKRILTYPAKAND
jgi:hypothetical protein